MECVLVMFKSDGVRRDIPLTGARNIVGRMSSCDVRIPLNSVSRQHCELLCDGKALRYNDLGSSNGVLHNGAKSKRGELKAGDELIIGPVIFTIMINGSPAKITPIRTILDDVSEQMTDKAIAETKKGIKKEDAPAQVKKSSPADTQANTVVATPAITPAVAVFPVATSVLAPKEIGSSVDAIEPLKGDSNFEEFNKLAPVKTKGAKSTPIASPHHVAHGVGADLMSGGKEKSSVHDHDSEEFEFINEHEGDEEESAFTFE